MLELLTPGLLMGGSGLMLPVWRPPVPAGGLPFVGTPGCELVTNLFSATLERYTPIREPGGGQLPNWTPYESTTCGAFRLDVEENMTAMQPSVFATDILYFDHDPQLQVRDRVKVYPDKLRLLPPRILLFRGTYNKIPNHPPWKVRAIDETWVMLQITGQANQPGESPNQIIGEFGWLGGVPNPP